ncbi:MAG: chemotaxis protein MotB [Pseudobdellovibrionaceae bacterium]|nr:chemotaxis protein MotB [Bdellovibrionales bacterium]USN46411.1 MAG: chemotaxis protein MotB [Pseudobdellovibrionaceae bacterium]
MADKEPVIVIKKINIQAAGAHGGSWKVAFADFMTAMMAFFLVMWLISQSEEVKQNVSDYFSTPSIIEYSFSNYGAELTLEKLFLDLMNEPLKFFEQFVKPIDKTPNIMAMGTKKIALHFMAEQMGDFGVDVSNINIGEDQIVFDIPARLLFLEGTGRPSSQFVDVMERVKGITTGLEDVDVYVDSEVYFDSGRDENLGSARNMAQQRLDLVVAKVRSTLENTSVDVYGKPKPVEFVQGAGAGGKDPEDMLRFRIQQKPFKSDGSKTRKLGEVFGKKDDSMNVYENFVKQVSEGRANELPEKRPFSK